MKGHLINWSRWRQAWLFFQAIHYQTPLRTRQLFAVFGPRCGLRYWFGQQYANFKGLLRAREKDQLLATLKSLLHRCFERFW